MSYSNSVSFIELLHGEVCMCNNRVFIKKVIKLTENFNGNKTGFVRPGHNYFVCLLCVDGRVSKIQSQLYTNRTHITLTKWIWSIKITGCSYNFQASIDKSLPVQ